MEVRQFNLQFEIKKYLTKLHSKTNLTLSDEIELEGHIYDGVESLEKKGLSSEEAFLITVKRIGRIDILSDEYNKVNPFFVSDQLRSYSVITLGLILSLGTVFLLVYELISMYRKIYLTQTSVDTLVKSILYSGLCIAVLLTFKWGKSFSVFLQKRIEQKPFLTASILFILPLLSFLLQPVIIRFFDNRGQQENFNYKLYDLNDVQYINLSFYLLVLSVLLITLVSFGESLKKQETSKKKFILKSPLFILILFGLIICMTAVMVRYIPQTNSGLQNSIFLAIVYTIGSFSIALHNNRNLWPKLIIFSLFGLCLGNLLVI